MTAEPIERGYLISEDAELQHQHHTQALLCLAALAEGSEPTPEQWAGMLQVLALSHDSVRAGAVFVQDGKPA